MSNSPRPELFFRIRDNGAAVFRIEGENRQRRFEMTQIASVNIRTGEIRPQGDEQPNAAEKNRIDDWVIERRKILVLRDNDDLLRLIDQINLAAHWAQSRGTDAQIDDIADRLLLAMHDLRSVLVRKQAERLKRT
jgi:hypothetical protein